MKKANLWFILVVTVLLSACQLHPPVVTGKHYQPATTWSQLTVLPGTVRGIGKGNVVTDVHWQRPEYWSLTVKDKSFFSQPQTIYVTKTVFDSVQIGDDYIPQAGDSMKMPAKVQVFPTPVKK